MLRTYIFTTFIAIAMLVLGVAAVSAQGDAQKQAEIQAANKKIADQNKILADAFKAGNDALAARNYDEAVKQYDIGLAVDPAQAVLLTNKARALELRGAAKYNAAIALQDKAARAAAFENAKADLKSAAESADKAADIVKKTPISSDPAQQKWNDTNKYASFNVRAEVYRVYVSRGDQSQTEAGASAFQDYLAIEPDPAKRSKGQLDLAKMLLDAGAIDKALVEYKKILATKPDDLDANLGAGLALLNWGDRSNRPEMIKYFQLFVDKAPDGYPSKDDAKAVLAVQPFFFFLGTNADQPNRGN